MAIVCGRCFKSGAQCAGRMRVFRCKRSSQWFIRTVRNSGWASVLGIPVLDKVAWVTAKEARSMDCHEILKRLAPCGVDCGRCVDYEGGEIKGLCLKIRGLLGDYRRVAKLKSDHMPVFSGCPQFEEILDLFCTPSCGGCRSQNVRCPIDCSVASCHKQKQVDFCFQCAEYPCENPMDPRLKERWRKRNDRMKEVGVEEFFHEQSRLPPY
jgi:hypothetical protein